MDTVIRKRQDLDEPLDPFDIADEVMNLHYEGVIGLIPLCVTAHELVHSDRIAIPLQLIYHRYDLFAKEYDPWIPEYVKDIVKLKAELSIKCNHIQSDILQDPTVTYVEVEGYPYPEVPDTWKNALARQRMIESGDDEASDTTAEEEKVS